MGRGGQDSHDRLPRFRRTFESNGPKVKHNNLDIFYTIIDEIELKPQKTSIYGPLCAQDGWPRYSNHGVTGYIRTGIFPEYFAATRYSMLCH